MAFADPQNTVKINTDTAGRLINSKWLPPLLCHQAETFPVIKRQHFKSAFMVFSTQIGTRVEWEAWFELTALMFSLCGKEMSVCKRTPPYFQKHTPTFGTPVRPFLLTPLPPPVECDILVSFSGCLGKHSSCPPTHDWTAVD